MRLFGGGSDGTEPEKAPSPTVFEPQPLEDWDQGDLPTGALPLLEPPDFYGTSARAGAKAAKGGKAGATAGMGEKSAKGAKKPRYEAKPPDPGLPEAERRAALREQMAEITKAFKDAPIEEMKDAIRDTLIAYGQEVPDDWVTTIAEGLRKNGPTKLNLDGVK